MALELTSSSIRPTVDLIQTVQETLTIFFRLKSAGGRSSVHVSGWALA